MLNHRIDDVHYREIPRNVSTPWRAARWSIYSAVNKVFSIGGFTLVQKGVQARARETMIDRVALDTLDACVRTVLRDRVPGDLIETGVWRGGACILMKAVLLAMSDTSRRVWVADSFRGLPKPNAAASPADTGSRLWMIPSACRSTR